MKNKKLLNPRGYISWTQVDMWLRSPERYKRRYFENEDDFENAAMRYGKATSEALESGERTDDELMNTVVALLPRYKEREYEIRVPLETQSGMVDLLGKLDTFEAVPLRFREYKTGVVPWNQSKASKHRQVHHYATLIYLKYGKLPTEAWLDWAETQRSGEDVSFTGRIESYPVKIGLREVVEYMALAGRVAREIDVEYRRKLKSLT